MCHNDGMIRCTLDLQNTYQNALQDIVTYNYTKFNNSYLNNDSFVPNTFVKNV